MSRARLAVSPRAVMRRLRPPGALAALLGIVAIVGLCWALTVAPWQSPDELSHYAYVESLATGPRLPGDPHRPIFSSDEALAAQFSYAAAGAYNPQALPPSWSRADYDSYIDNPEALRYAVRANGGGPTSASGNPPLYYLIATIGYLVDGGGTAYSRLYAIRLEGVVFLLLTALGAWLLAGETFGRRRIPQLCAAATAALLPMVSFISTDVNPDALLITEWTLSLWLAARVVNHRARPRDVAGLGVLLAAAILTKATSYALVPAELLAVAIGMVRRPPAERVHGLLGVGAASLLTVIPLVVWLSISHSVGGVGVTAVYTAGHPFSLRNFVTYLWQFYLPRLPFMGRFRLQPGIPAVTVWIDGTSGEFGWLSVFVPSWMFTAAKLLLAIVVLVTAWLLSRLRGRRKLALLAVDAVALVSLLGLLHIVEYEQTLGGGGAFLQGRYILPVVSLVGLAVGFIVARLPRAIRAPAATCVIVGLLAWQALSLATIVHAYYL